MTFYKKKFASKIDEIAQPPKKEAAPKKMNFMDHLACIMDKSKCYDIFQGTVVQGMQMY